MKTRLGSKPIGTGILCVALCFGTASAQDQNANSQGGSQPASASAAKGGSGEDQYPDLVEIDPFGGISIYGQVLRGLTTKLADGGVAGVRVGVNPTKYFGIELWADYAQANVSFKSSSGVYPAGNGGLTGTPLPTYSFGARNYLFGLNPIFNLTPRGSKVQPYVTVGVNGTQFSPTDTAKGLARQPVTNNLYHSANLNDNLQVGLNYGGGIKFHLTDHFGLRLDARGFWSRNPTYNLPNYPTGGIYIPAKDKINGFQGTLGLVWYLGQSKCPEMPPAPASPPALPQPTITGAEGTICPGKPVNLHVTLSGVAPDRKLSYQWTVNGQTQGSDSPDLSYTPSGTSAVNVQVTVTDKTPLPAPLERPKKFPLRCWTQPAAPQAAAPVTATSSFTPNSQGPSVTASASPTTLVAAVDQGPHTATLTANGTAGPCNANLTYKWTVSEGSLTNDSTNSATFDASSLNFEGGQNQSKTVTATVTVTDDAGHTATASTTITVNYTPPFIRLDDVVFAKDNSRVNNCGKRLLIDDLSSRLASGDYDVVLVGHRDSDEKENVPMPRRRRRRGEPAPTPHTLDEQRVLNSAAVMSGGTGTCGKVDPSRVKVDWVGTDQSSETKPSLCGTSNVKERKNSVTTEADKNRRVEIYLVPHNSTTMPPAVKNARPLPDDVKALGCPK